MKRTEKKRKGSMARERRKADEEGKGEGRKGRKERRKERRGKG